MEALPTLAAFAAAYEAGAAQVVWTRLVADLGDPRLGLPEARPRQADELSAGVGRRRRRARALFRHRPRAGPGMARRRRSGVHQPHAGGQARRVHARAATDARLAARIARRFADRVARRAAADGGRHLRLHGLRHRAPDGAAAEHAARRPAHSRRHPHAPDGDGHLRHHQGRDHHRLAGAPGRQSAGGKSLQGRVQAPEGRRRRAQRAAAALAGRHLAQDRGAQADVQHHARRIQGDGAAAPRSTSSPATSSRSSSRSASRRRSPCRRSPSTAPCAVPTPRRSSSISTSAASPSSARAPRSWCACAKAR